MRSPEDIPKTFCSLGRLGKSLLFNADISYCRNVTNDNLVAIKCLDTDFLPSSLLALLQHEVRLSRNLSHSNVITFSSIFLHGSKLCMVMPLMEYGSCTDIMSAHFKYGLSEHVIALIMREVLKALVYIHSMRLIHRGIKGSHILVSKTGAVKLTGHRNVIELTREGVQVRKVHDFPKHDTSLLPWLSPEILQQNMQGYDTKSDIYSLGITACELANGHAPFIDMPSTQMLLEKLNGTIPYVLDESTVPPPSDIADDLDSSTVNLNHEVTRLSMIKTARSRRFSPPFHKFVTDSLEREPELRLTAEELLKHPFLKQLKNRSNMEIFQPIFKELTPVGSDRKDGDSQPEDLTVTQMGELSIDDTEWDFGS
ncbi:STE20-related kinase adapter protein alpha-like [Styela clava]